MKKLLMGVAALPFLASIAMAGESIVINDSQMDRVTAGHNQFFGGITIHYPDYYGSPGSTCGGGPGCIPAGSTPDNPGHPGAATILGPVGPTAANGWSSWHGPAPTILTGPGAAAPPPDTVGIYHRVP